MVARTDALPISLQCELLELPRSTFYHVPDAVSDAELELMKLIDQCHLKHPYFGSRRVRDWLEDRGHRVNRKRVRRLMRTIGLVAVYPKRNLSLSDQAHKVQSVSAARCGRRPTESSLGNGHYVRSDGARLRVPGRRYGLVLTACAVVARVEYPGHELLHRRPERSHRTIWAAGDIQHRPGQPVHERCVHWRAQAP